MTPITQLLSTQAVVPGLVYDPDATIKAEFGRLIHAAIINRSFCDRLLANPLVSIEGGYCGESFQFPTALKQGISSIQAGTLEEFSTQMMRVVESPCLAELPVLQYR